MKYSYVRFRWWDPVDLDMAVEEFSDFKTKKIIHAKGGQDISLYRDQRDEVEVEADTLQALLSPFRVVLNQKEVKPFTVRDIDVEGEDHEDVFSGQANSVPLGVQLRTQVRDGL